MDWLDVLKTFGLPVVCLFALAMVVYRGLVWVGVNIAKPVADRHIKFLDELSTAMSSQSVTIQTMQVQNTKNLETVGRVLDHLDLVMSKLDKLIEVRGQRRRAKNTPEESP